MPRSRTSPTEDDFTERILDVDVSAEMQTSFLEYAYSVIYSRALPDARDGLKPVQRRILYAMEEMNLRPDRNHVKCARVVGQVMGLYHPHGDGAIYDALVRQAQAWTMRLPLVDGHGNFGSPDAGPAAMRYTECRMAAAARAMTAGLDQDTVDFRPNYDGQDREPGVLPAAIPNLLVNGSSGIAVGMATNIAPHNLIEVVQALRHLLKHPQAGLDTLLRFIPGPDLPTGGKIVGLDGIRDAYASGRGSFRMRATARIEQTSPRRKGIVVSELPLGVGPEKVIEQLKTLVQAKKLQGIADVKDLTDLTHGTRLVIEVKNGFHPDVLLEQLYKATALETSFGINAVALVEGQPRTLSLHQLLTVFLEHRLEVVLRRSRHDRERARERLHLIEGLLVAILDIDSVIAVIRRSDDAAAARAALMDVFELSEAQASYILEMPLRRLTRFSRIELESERDTLGAEIERLSRIIDDDAVLRETVADELAAVAKEFGTPRRTVLLAASGVTATTAAAPLEVTDDPCWVLLSSSRLVARTPVAEDGEIPAGGGRAGHDVVRSRVRSTARGEVGVVTSRGRLLRLPVLDLPQLPPTAVAWTLQGGVPLSELLELGPDERVLCLTSLDPDAPGLALATRDGVVKRVNPEPLAREDWEIITLKPGDELVGAADAAAGDELVFCTSDAQLLRFGADLVRPQGRAGGGIAGVKLGPGARLVAFAVVPAADVERAAVVTVAGSSTALPGTDPGSVKVTPLAQYPGKGRGTGGVRCMRLLKGEDALLTGWAGADPAAAAGSGVPVPLPDVDPRRDGSGVPLEQGVEGLGSRRSADEG